MDKKTPVGGLKSNFPMLDWLPRYKSEWLRFEIIAALSVCGLLGYALLGTSGLVVTGPSAAIAAVSGSVMTLWAATETNEWTAHTAPLAVFAGLVYILLGVRNSLRLLTGFFTTLPNAVPGAVVIDTGISLVKIKEFEHAHLSNRDFAASLATAMSARRT